MFDKAAAYAEVILPIAVDGLFTYGVTEEFLPVLHPGQRVIVPFGKQHYYTGIVRYIREETELSGEIKFLDSLIEEYPLVNESDLQFWEWLADYYCCSIGEVMQAALPAGLKLSSESLIVPLPEFDNEEELDDQAYIIWQSLQSGKELNFEQIQKLLAKQRIQPIIKQMLDLGAIRLEESLVYKYKPRTEVWLSLSNPLLEDEQLQHQALNDLQRAPRQLAAFEELLHIQDHRGIARKELSNRSGVDIPVINKLVEKGLLQSYEVEVDRLNDLDIPFEVIPQLDEQQTQALSECRSGLDDHQVALLHGVTSSGKTLIYHHLINDTLNAGKRVLFLVPEISLTVQLVRRIQRHCPVPVGVYHSRFSNAERVEIYEKVRNGHYQVILGARSSLLLPLDDIGLIIVDEEHDPSYKQFDPAPRYNARDAAVFLGKTRKIKVLLGSATPSIESLVNARQEKYGYARMSKRFGDLALPKVERIDLRKMKKHGSLHSQFGAPLLDEIRKVLAQKGQVILFHNRRGYSTYMICTTCGWVPECKNCDVSLTYHKYRDELRCHLCGYRVQTAPICQSCGDNAMKQEGFGTEKLEDELNALIPNAKVIRLDYESARSRSAFEQIISSFEQGEYDIMVGTQMVTKGLDFDNVRLVGVISADQLLFHNDFRANERAFQLLTQVSGRAGRKDEVGKVMIQAYKVDHPVIEHVLLGQTKRFYEDEIRERGQFGYPPYKRLIHLTVKHKKPEITRDAAYWLSNRLSKIEGVQLLGPVIPAIGRVRNLYHQEMMLKMKKNNEVIQRTKRILMHQIQQLHLTKPYTSVRVRVDVDP